MRTIRVTLTLHAAVRWKARTNAREPALRAHTALPRSAVLAGLDLAVPGGRFRLAPLPLAGEYLASTFVDATSSDSPRAERVAVVWAPVRT